MKWTDDMAIGHATIDAQHRELIECISELELATAEHRTLLAVYCITRLKHFVRDHFKAEEAVMRECGFPKLKEHIKEHEEFRAKLLDLQINSVQLDVTSDTVEFLGNWLVDHARTSDKEVVPYLKKLR
jgi:hemerythrin